MSASESGHRFTALSKKRGRTQTYRRVALSKRLSLEQLEPRRLLSADELLFSVIDDSSISPTNSGLVSMVNVSEGLAAPIHAQVPFLDEGFTGLAFTSRGDLFATTSDGPGSTSDLVTINPTTGAELRRVSLFVAIDDLAVHPIDGQVYGISAGTLYTINTVTGIATAVGDTGTSSSGGLGFTPDGKLYLAGSMDRLFRIDPSTGNVLDTITMSGGPVALGDINGMTGQADGTLLGTDMLSGRLVRIDPGSGVRTLVPLQGPDSGVMGDIAFRPSSSISNLTQLYYEDFEQIDHGFTIDNSGGQIPGFWSRSLGRRSDELINHTATHSFYYGSFETSTGGGTYITNPLFEHQGVISSPEIDLPETGTSIVSFSSLLDTRLPTDVDFVEVRVDNGTGVDTILSRADGTLPQTGRNKWLTSTYDLSPYAGQTIRLQFSFNTGPAPPFDPEGWYVDDILIVNIVEPAAIHGQKFHDIDGDGVRDATEPGLNGVEITLTEVGDPNGNGIPGETLATMITMDFDVDGNGQIDPITESGRYWFEGIAAGTYTIRELPPPGPGPTTPNPVTVTLAPGEEIEVNFGNQFFGEISGIKYEDVDEEDGVFNGSDAGLAGWTIAAFTDNDGSGTLTAGDTLADSNVTGAGGTYSLTLDPGRYIVVELMSDQGVQWRESPDTDTFEVNTFDATYGRFGYDITLASGQRVDERDFANFQLDPSYTIDKTVTDVDGDGTGTSPVDAVGDVITYQIEVVNTGNQTLTGVLLADTLVASVGAPVESLNADGNLEVGETWTWTYTYTATQADFDNNGGGDGDIDNTAMVSSDQLSDESGSAAVPIDVAPAYTIDKTVTDVDGDGTGTSPVDAVGDVITYQIEVVNTGNQTLTGVLLADTLVASVGAPVESLNADGNLEVGETWTWTYTYTATQADFDNNGGGDGDIDNTAMVSSDQLSDESGSAAVPIDVAPAYTIDKTATGIDTFGDGVINNVGEVIEYTVAVENTGNLTLAGVLLADTLIAAVGLPVESLNADGTLEVGETWTYTYDYTVLQADFDTNGGGDGDIDNTATVSSDQLPDDSSSAEVPIIVDPGYAIVKTATGIDTAGNGVIDNASEVIEYTVTVINDGNQTLTGVVLADTLVAAVGAPVESFNADGNLEVGETWTYTYTYAATQADFDTNGGGDGDIDNTATVSSNQLPDDSDSAEVMIDVDPAYTIDKTATGIDTAGNGVIDNAGEVIEYTVTVMNDGNQTLTGVVLEDTLVAAAGAPVESLNTDGNLEVGETWTWTYTYTVLQSDFDNDGGGDGDIDNTAMIGSDQLSDESASAAVPIDVAPAYTIDKTVTDVDGDGTGTSPVDAVGDVITYQIEVVNTGNQTLTGVVLADTLVAAVGLPVESLNADGNLEVGETWTYAYTYTVTQADIVNVGGGDGDIDNTAMVSSDQLSDESGSAAVPIDVAPAQVAIFGIKFDDNTNGDGVRDPGEPGLESWQFRLYEDSNKNGILDQQEFNQQDTTFRQEETVSGGSFAFSIDITAGQPVPDYILVEVLQTGWIQTEVPGLRSVDRAGEGSILLDESSMKPIKALGLSTGSINLGEFGYSLKNLADGDEVTNADFGNRIPTGLSKNDFLASRFRTRASANRVAAASSTQQMPVAESLEGSSRSATEVSLPETVDTPPASASTQVTVLRTTSEAVSSAVVTSANLVEEESLQGLATEATVTTNAGVEAKSVAAATVTGVPIAKSESNGGDSKELVRVGSHESEVTVIQGGSETLQSSASPSNIMVLRSRFLASSFSTSGVATDSSIRPMTLALESVTQTSGDTLSAENSGSLLAVNATDTVMEEIGLLGISADTTRRAAFDNGGRFDELHSQDANNVVAVVDEAFAAAVG